jgi:hypothetical protein
MSEAGDQAYTGLYQKLDTMRAKMMFIRWLKFEKGRQDTSTKLNVSMMNLIGFW